MKGGGIAMARKKQQEEAKTEQISSTVTYLGEGGLSGEYRFAEFAGSISASSKEEAIQKAEELAAKHPSLLIK